MEWISNSAAGAVKAGNPAVPPDPFNQWAREASSPSSCRSQAAWMAANDARERAATEIERWAER